MADVATTLRLEGKSEGLACLNETVQNYALGMDFSRKRRRFIAVACDEIFSNIVKYAYSESVGLITIYITVQNETGELILRFSDSGIPFNPLTAVGADTSAPLEERPVGKMGINIVKELANSVSYAHENGQNVLTLIFRK